MNDSTNITPETVAGLAKLARLQLTEEEINSGAEQLHNVLQNFSKVQAIDVKNVSVSRSISGLQNVARPDEAKADNLCPTDELLKNAPQLHKGQFKVKAVFS